MRGRALETGMSRGFFLVKQQHERMLELGRA